MSFCPKCRYEYKPGLTICPDCDEPLVDVLPEPESDEPKNEDTGDWVPMAVLNSPQYANMLEEALRAKYIPIIVKSAAGHFGQIGAIGTDSVFSASRGYLILIKKEFLAEADYEAKNILGDIWEKSKLIDLEE